MRVLRWNLKSLSGGLNPPKSAKTRFKFSADLNLETFNTILSLNLNRRLNSLNSATEDVRESYRIPFSLYDLEDRV